MLHFCVWSYKRDSVVYLCDFLNLQVVEIYTVKVMYKNKKSKLYYY
jgi:hypothetical protein